MTSVLQQAFAPEMLPDWAEPVLCAVMFVAIVGWFALDAWVKRQPPENESPEGRLR